MARAGTQRWRNPAPEGDDVQRSIELLDKVLSEYDEHEVEGEGGGGGGGGGVGGGGGGGGGGVVVGGLATTDCSSSTEPSIGLTPDDESPSLGHQSEDDGYMSMNGRKAKMALVALRPVPDCPEPQDPTGAPAQEFPPPPEEAERIISTLLPMVSPGNSSKRSGQKQQQQQQQPGRNRGGGKQQWMAAMDDPKRPGHAVTTQTTLPKTRHQRPYGWENGGNLHTVEPFRLADPPSPPSKFASLPYDGKVSFNWTPARSAPTPVDGKKRRQSSEDGLEDLRQSSEDGLDEEDEVDDEAADDADEDGDDDDDDDIDDDDDDDDEDESNRPSPEKERSASAHNNHHHLHHHLHSRRPPRQTEICKSSSVEDRLLMNNHHQHQQQQQQQPQNSRSGASGSHSSCGGSRHLNNGGGGSGNASTTSNGGGGGRRRNNSDSSEGRFSRAASEAESRGSMPRSSSVSVERFSMRANCDSSDFSRANSMSNERFHSDFSIAVASASSNDHVSVPTSEPFSIRNLDFVSFSLPHADSSERFSAQTSDRCSEERYSEVFSTRNSDFSTRNSTDFRTQSEEEHFSDDSLEELLPPPPALSKRHSIAWEVSLDDDPLYVPGSTKVVGRRRRKSSDVSSVGSASKLRDFDDWQDPRVSTTDDDLISPYSDSSTNDLDQLRPQDLSKSGTYVIRRGRKKERKLLPKSPSKSLDDETRDSRLTEVRRFSNTFDNIKSLLKENSKLEGVNEPPSEFSNSQAVSQPDLVHVPTKTSSCERREKRRSAHREPEPLPMTKEKSNCPEDLQPEQQQQQQQQPQKKEQKSEEQPEDNSTEPMKITSFAERTKECNGITITTSKSLDVSRAAQLIVDEVPTRRSINSDHHSRLESKIPVNLLIEDQIVKKALNENRRQLEKVSDAIKEIESVKNSCVSEFADTGSGRQRWRSNGDCKLASSKRNSFENDSCERRLLDVSAYDSRQPHARKAQPPPPVPPPHATDLTDGASKPGELDFERRRLNGGDIYSSGRRTRVGDLENHKNDTKQIENVIDAILEDSKNPDFQVSVEVLEFPPLPPSPVEEADEESSDVGGSGGCNGSATRETKPKVPGHANRTMEYRPRVPPHRGISLDSSKEHHQTTSLNTRSMDAGYSRGRRTAAGIANARREVPVERRTLPTDLPGPSRRRPFTKRHSPSTEACSSTGNGSGGIVGAGNTATGMQTSCSLPETPVFARGSDIPRTPQHASGGNPTQPRRQPGWYAPTTATTGYRRNNPGLAQAIIGTELLRLAGGPNRGWYPTRKSNQPRPASIEHLERLNSAYDARLPGAGEQRKPLTLPTNITPNKYFGQSKHSSTSSTREALRRVTSLLIKKGGGSKDGKNGKDNLSPSGPYAGVEASDAPKKKGFFKNFWKRSRHYSLENQ